MALTQLGTPYPVFTDKDGTPLDAGFLYFGEQNENPETSPITVYYDAALTQAAAQPLRTTNGYVMRNGSPAILYASTLFSVTVRNSQSELVIYAPVSLSSSASGAFVGPATFSDVATLLADTTLSYSVSTAAGDIVRTSSEGFAYEVAASGAVDENVTTAGGVKLYVQAGNSGINAAAFGVTGDGVTDDTTAIQAALDFSKANGVTVFFNSGTYICSTTLDLNDGFDDAASMSGIGGAGREPSFQFAATVPIGLSILNSKATMIKNIKVDMSNVTVDCVGVFVNAMWESQFNNVIVSGPGSTNPASGQVSYGIALRPTYNGAATTWTAATELEAIQGANTGLNMGVYWNEFTRLRVSSFGYGIMMLGAEGGTNPRTNQNQFNSCNFNDNYYDVWLQGIGGGIVFTACTAEGADADAVTVENVSGGTGPVWIGGEVSATGDKWKGPGLLMNAVAGTDFPTANSDGQIGTHMRFTDQAPQLYGSGLTGSGFLSDWASKQDVLTGGGATTSLSFDVCTITADGSGSDTAVYEVSVALQRSSSPQGSSSMVYHVTLNRATGQPLTAAAFSISSRTVWHNLGGGSVAPDITVSVVGTVATVTANVNWDSVGSSPAEVDVITKVKPLTETATWTLAVV